MHNSAFETVFCVPEDSNWLIKVDEDGLRHLTEEEKQSYMEVLERYLSLTKRTDTP